MALTRRNVLQGIAALITGCSTLPKAPRPKQNNSSTFQQLFPDLDPSRNIGFLALDLEREAGIAVPNECYYILSTFIREMEEQRIPFPYQPIPFLRTIDALLLQEKFSFTPEQSLLSVALTTRLLDCDTASFIYLSIAEDFNAPLSCVYAPGHAFVRWHNPDQSYINWETIIRAEKKDEEYQKRFNIPEESIKNQTYLRSLSKAEALGITCTNIGTAFLEKAAKMPDPARESEEESKKAIIAFNKALTLFPHYITALNNKGIALTMMSKYQEAIECFDKAIILEPNKASAFYNKAKALCELGDYEKAIKIYDALIEMSQGNPYLDMIFESRQQAILKQGLLSK